MATGTGPTALSGACLKCRACGRDQGFRKSHCKYFSGPNQSPGRRQLRPQRDGQGRRLHALCAQSSWTECCPGNVNRFMPNYAARMWMMTDGKGAPVVAALCGPSQVSFAAGKAKVPDDRAAGDRNYPLSTGDQLPDPRAPRPWHSISGCASRPGCRKPRLSLNGKALAVPKASKGFSSSCSGALRAMTAWFWNCPWPHEAPAALA